MDIQSIFNTNRYALYLFYYRYITYGILCTYFINKIFKNRYKKELLDKGIIMIFLKESKRNKI